MKKILLFLSFLLMSIGLYAQTTTTYTFTSKSWAATPANWTSGKDGNQLTAGQGVQVTSGVSGANATSPKSFTNISSITVTYCTNASKGEGSIKVKVGNGTEKSFTVTKPSSGGTTLKTTTFNYTPTETGTVLLTVTCSTNSIYIYSISITENATDIDVTGVSIIDTLRLIEGNSETIIPIITPENATNKNVTWGSTNTGVATVSNGEVNAVSIGTTKVWVKTEDGNKTDTCVVIVLPIPPEPSIDIAVWDTNAVYINIDNFEGVSAQFESSNSNIAEDLFFSKYFEASSENKMIAIYNGTDHDIALSDYRLERSHKGSSGVETRRFELDTLGRIRRGYICQNEEIILARFTDGTNSADTCAEKQSNYGSWYTTKSGSGLGDVLNFSGPMSIGLYQKSKAKYIDVIGASTNSNGTGTLIQINASNKVPCAAATNDAYNDGAGFYTESGDSINGSSHNYFLSTNRCLLIRKNSVKSGANAVQNNVYSTNLDCSVEIATSFTTLNSEWVGYRIGNKKEEEHKLTCEGMGYVGGYNYNNYYSSSVDLIDALQEDGTYMLPISKLDTLSCNNIKIIARDNSGNTTQEIFKVPIMVAENKTSSQVLSKHGVSCPTCDLVVMHGATLTIDNALSNRDVKVYAGSRLLINSGKTYTANSLSLRKTNDSSPYLTLNGTLALSGDSSLYFDLYLDPSQWRWIALPETFDIRTLTLSNGKKGQHRVDYWFKTYDGEYRSINLKNGWKSVADDKIFQPGEGFIFGIAGDNNYKKEYRFKFANSALTREKASPGKTLTWDSLRAWGCDNAELRPNHKGWNLIGNPYMDKLTAEIYQPIRIGYLVKEIVNGNWTGNWELSDTTSSKLRYRVVHEDNSPGEDGNGYSSQLLDGIELEPFSTFFIQLGGDPSTIANIPIDVAKKRSIISRSTMVDEDDELFLRIFVGDKKTGCFISNKFIDDYEPGDDFESRQSIYQSINGYKLLYSAVPDSTLIKGVIVHSNGGRITLDSKVDINKFEQINVFYNNKWYSLLYGETVDVEAGDFLLQAIRKQQDVPTDIDNVKPSNGLYKFTDGKYIYINKNGYIYNILGTKLK